jgi:hypothetical protein
MASGRTVPKLSSILNNLQKQSFYNTQQKPDKHLTVPYVKNSSFLYESQKHTFHLELVIFILTLLENGKLESRLLI